MEIWIGKLYKPIYYSISIINKRFCIRYNAVLWSSVYFLISHISTGSSSGWRPVYCSSQSHDHNCRSSQYAIRSLLSVVTGPRSNIGPRGGPDPSAWRLADGRSHNLHCNQWCDQQSAPLMSRSIGSRFYFTYYLHGPSRKVFEKARISLALMITPG